MLKKFISTCSSWRFNKMQSGKHLLISALALCLSFTPPLIAQDTKAQKVGAVLGLTGYAADHADGIRRGMELALEDLKAANSLHLQINFQDDATIPIKTVTAFKQLLSQNYRYFIGPTWSFQIKAAAPLIKQSGSIAIAPAGSSEVGGGPSQGLFFLSPTRTAVTPQLATFLKEKKYKKAFLLTAQVDWGLVHAAIYKKALAEAGVEITGEEFFDYSSLDQAAINPLFLKIKNLRPDIILTTGPATNIFDMVKARDTLQLNCALFGTENNWELITRNLMKPQEIKEVYGMRAPHNPIFVERYRKKYSEEPKQYAAEGYDTITILNLLAQQPIQTNVELQKFLFNHVALNGMSGKISFNEQGDIKEPVFEILPIF